MPNLSIGSVSKRVSGLEAHVHCRCVGLREWPAHWSCLGEQQQEGKWYLGMVSLRISFKD
ncbi:hypothetical protein BDZ97DRAFT_1803065 [Flammula alnicola]|nr:hypothetical protein BDZ97DRAFT_1803065 [Flammula alnicola]